MSIVLITKGIVTAHILRSESRMLVVFVGTMELEDIEESYRAAIKNQL